MDDSFTPMAGDFSFVEVGLGVERVLHPFFFFGPGLGVDFEAGAFFFIFFDPGLGVDQKISRFLSVFGARLGADGDKGKRETTGGGTDPFGSASMELARSSKFCFKSSIKF
jgi:hypothetical protein